MGSKKWPDEFDCYLNAEEDEPMFIVLARDKDAPMLVRMWALMREQAIEMGAKPPSDLAMVTNARQCAYEMERWRRANRGDDRQLPLKGIKLVEKDTEGVDDGLPWGYIDPEVGDWIVLAKGPLINAGFGPPPFEITLPSGIRREVIHQPKPMPEA